MGKRRFFRFLILSHLILGIFALYFLYGEKRLTSPSSFASLRPVNPSPQEELTEKRSNSKKFEKEEATFIQDNEVSAEDVQDLSEEEFRLYFSIFESELPRLSEAELSGKEFRTDRQMDLSRETPEVLLDAGELIGQLEEVMDLKEELVPVGLEYLTKCALDETRHYPVRALCLKVLNKYKKTHSANLAPEDLVIDPIIQAMAKELGLKSSE